MGVVSFRVSDDDAKALRRAGKKPSEVAKAAVEAEARRAKVEEQMRFLRDFARPSRKPTLETIREMRENRDAHR
ncbi:MAG TPA: hypothetical protein VI796_05055 [Candidatus Thermoplasmatota archaeon]|nr:hypothetical protein [Candidatus Thermoplasmatota archaeon]